MKIAIFRKDLGNYSETFVRRNIASLAGGNTVVIGSRLVDGHTWKPDKPTLLLGHVPSLFQPALVRLFLKRHRVDAAICEFLDYATLWAPLLTKLGIPFLSLGHGFDIGRAPKGRSNHYPLLPTLERGRKILVPCEYAKTVLLQRAPLSPESIESIPVGIELDPFKNTDLRRTENRLLFVGRFVEKKAPMGLLVAFEQAVRQEPSLTLDCIGEGPFLGAAKQLARCMGLQEKVNFLGAKPHKDVVTHLKKAKAVVQHSVTAENGDMETMPLSVQEALACGTPAVVTSHAGLPDIVTHGKTGYIVPEYACAAMADRIVQLARLSAEDYRAMQEAGIKESARFDYRIRLRRMEALLAQNQAFT